MNKVFFEQNHWSDPRGTIASVYQDNDYGYVFHATSILIDVLEFVDWSILDCKGKSILDYGCGTGRVTRQFALTGAKVEGYDPVTECILEADKELEKIGDRYKKPMVLSDSLSDIGDNFDLIYCVNVIEHLDPITADIALMNIEQRMVDGAVCVIWIHASKNIHFCRQHNLDFGDHKGVVIVKGVKTNDAVQYTPIYRK